MQALTETYAGWAEDYFEVEVDRDAVAEIYDHCALTEDLVQRVNPDAKLSKLKDLLVQIGYPGV